MIDPPPTREDKVGCLWVVVFVILTWLGVCTLPQPADALEPCVRYATVCVPGYVLKYLPPEPASKPVAAVSVAVLTREQHARQIAEHFWPDWAVPRMMRIAECESGFDPWAVNPRSGATGLFQIMPFWKKQWPGDYKDAWTNGAVAYQIWLDAGRRGDPFSPWVCK